MVDIGLRVVSVIVFLILLYQKYGGEKGDHRHVVGGYSAMIWGAILIVLVAIRSTRQEVFTAWYIAHLVVGAAFFVFLFAAGYFGWQTKNDNDRSPFPAAAHYLAAQAAFFTLLGSLALGIISKFAH